MLENTWVTKSLGKVEAIQERFLEFLILEQFGDNDPRVRSAAASALVNVLPKLWFHLLTDAEYLSYNVVSLRESMQQKVLRSCLFNLNKPRQPLIGSCNATYLMLYNNYSRRYQNNI